MSEKKKERRILVAVDEGEESMHALTWCLNNLIHPNSDDTLILLYSKPPRVLYSSAIDGPSGFSYSGDLSTVIERYSDQVAESVMEKAKKICADLQPQVKVERMVENGDARDVICEAAEKLGVDVLVMGSHGYGVIKRAFLGSVSNHCAQKAKCPVLIVKKPTS